VRIAVIALTDFQEFPTGGILTFVRRFAQAVGKMEGVQAALIGWSPQPGNGQFPRHISVGHYEYDFFPVGHGRFQRLVPDRIQFSLSRDRWRHVLQAVGEVDAYYCHSPEAVLRVEQFGCGAPIALHIHGAINTVGRSRFTLGRSRIIAAAYEQLVLNPALKASKAVFATISDTEFGALRRRKSIGENSLCVRIPAMVNPSGSPPPARGSNDVLRLVCVGRLEAIKGVDLVIQAVAQLAQRGIPCELRIIGSGSGRQQLERLTERLSLQSQIRFVGTLIEEDVQSALSEADVFLSGSHQEGFSLALLEALAQGLPAVVTAVGSARDVICDGVTGYVIDRRDAGLFAERVLAAAAGAASMRARCVLAAEPYSSEVVSGTIVKTLSGIVNGVDAEVGTDPSAAEIVATVHS
jgi:glycosyltransferase involved in cell wall biosynthesis